MHNGVPVCFLHKEASVGGKNPALPLDNEGYIHIWREFEASCAEHHISSSPLTPTGITGRYAVSHVASCRRLDRV